jgi:hypothetical protein
MKCTTGGKAGCCGGLDERRSQKAETANERESGSPRFIGSSSERKKMNKGVQISRKGKGLAVPRVMDLWRQSGALQKEYKQRAKAFGGDTRRERTG